MGRSETGGRTALPIFREIMLRIYQDRLVGPAPRFPSSIENGIDQYVATQAALKAGRATMNVPLTGIQDQP
jgi:membrane carboxypeptidase/penicillin-binding protein